MLRPVRERYQQLRTDDAELRSILEQGAAHARSVADDTLSLMRQRRFGLPLAPPPANNRCQTLLFTRRKGEHGCLTPLFTERRVTRFANSRATERVRP